MKKRTLALLLAMVMALSLAACGSDAGGNSSPPANSASSGEGTPDNASDDPFADAPQLKFQFAENQPSNSTIGVLGQEFCDKVKERTNGTLQIEFYPDALLGDEATVVGMIEAGTVEFTRVNLAAIQATVPELGVLTLPYIYKDGVHCQHVLDSDVGQDLLAKCSEHGFVGVALSGGDRAGNGSSLSRCFYSSTPIHSVADLQGKKIRVQESDVVIKMVEALGGVATPMAYGDVFQALQTKIVDIAENDPMSYVMSGHYEVAKYYALDNHQISPSIYIMSQKAWDSMNEAQRKVFQECLVEYLDEQSEEQGTMLAEYRKQAEDAGCEFIEVDTAEFQEACQSVYDMFPEYADYIERIKAID